MRNYIPVDVNNMPDIFDISLANDVFTFRIDYNEVADYYTVTIWRNGKRLLTQEPLLLGQLVGIDIPNPELPRIDIRTMDETGTAADAGKGNFSYDVQMYLDVVDPNGSETDDPSVKPLGYDPSESDDDFTDEEVSY
ncbi:hypothetical protein EFS28_09890 [Lactobacillus acidophilus]|uniref:phage baseplate plug family protein n=1 Tax=Lactobacillus acidophilus TaxID=1579 RepID=UPI0021A8FDBA|nr:hypothetical protein [Lactobacillus acidophilus]MCT3602263.1 hypothetical protein [Lactobacillus acidophilus]MCT3624502.1 hypothetical protein [Lactobacillus acidophilus]